jgi:hypothetical protein
MNAKESNTRLYSPVVSDVVVGYVVVAISSTFLGLVVGWLIWAQ